MSNYRKYFKRKRRGTIKIYHVIPKEKTEFDYDKLAEAIVKARNESDKQQTERKSFVSNSFAFWISLFFRLVPVFGMAVCGIGVFAIIDYAVNIAVWNTINNIIANVFLLWVMGVLLVSLGAYCIIMWKAAKEIEREKDKNFIVSVFSGIVSFAALIVALVALFKGVG